MLALGSQKEYPDTYCNFGHRIAVMATTPIGSHALFDTIEVRQCQITADIQRWNNALASGNQA